MPWGLLRAALHQKSSRLCTTLLEQAVNSSTSLLAICCKASLAPHNTAQHSTAQHTLVKWMTFEDRAAPTKPCGCQGLCRKRVCTGGQGRADM